MREMPQLVELQEQMSDELRVIAVSIDAIEPLGGRQDAASIAAFSTAKEFDSLDLVLYTGERSKLKSAPWKLPSAIPFNLVLNAKGEVSARHEGPLDSAGLRNLVASALTKD